VAHGLEHPAHLPVAPLANRHQQETVAIRPPFVQQHDVGGQRALAVQRNALPQPGDRLLVRYSRHLRFVGAIHFVAWVRQRGGEVAVIGEQEQAFSVVVEPSDRIDVLAHAAQQIDDGGTPLRIRPRGHVPLRLVQEDVAMALRGLHAASVDADVVSRRIGLDAHFAYGLPVDRHASFGDQFLRRAPGGDARLRQHLL
jgi:hypothetical protein